LTLKSDFYYKDYSEEANPVQYEWNPSIKDWRDVIEVYLSISREKSNNKLLMFKLQLWILDDYITNIKSIDKLKENLGRIETGSESESHHDNEKDINYLRKEIFETKRLNRILKDVMDGVAWRIFGFNRAILYLLADKEPVNILRPDEGLINSILIYSKIFINPQKTAILNDLTSFLRVGDITVLHENGDIELIEVKGGGKKRKKKPRIRRQKKRMEEIVEFVNTGFKEHDGKTLRIRDSLAKQKNYLNKLGEAIKESSQNKGFSIIHVGDYMVVSVFNYGSIEGVSNVWDSITERIDNLIGEWKQNGDFLFPIDILAKYGSKNIAPTSIFPFEVDVCADILCGKIGVSIILNISKVIRKFELAGWEILDSMMNKIETDSNEIDTEFICNHFFIKIKKGDLILDVPPSMFARIQFEFISPDVILEEIEKIYIEGSTSASGGFLINYLDEQNIWR
jgi:hypothetical protein